MYQSDQIKEVKYAGNMAPMVTHMQVQNFNRNTWGDNIKKELKKWDMRVHVDLKWLRIGSSGGFL